MSTPGGGSGDAGRAAQERLTQEARATASALIDWLGTRVEAPPRATSPGTSVGGSRRSRLGMRPPQSPGPCSWCPVCALVAALRGEQPELTARLAEQASGLMMLLRLMVQAHQEPGHAHHTHADPSAPPPGADQAPPGWPPEWGPWDGWGGLPPDGPEPSRADAPRAGRADAPRAGRAGAAGADDVAAAAADEPAAAAAGGAAATAPEPGPPAGARGTRPRRPAAGGPPGGRRVPIRRASPRSATFREATGGAPGAATPTGPTGPAAPAGRPGPTSAHARSATAPRADDEPSPRRPASPTTSASTPRPAPEATAPPTTAPPTTAPPSTAPPGTDTPAATTGGAARPSVQRIAIRRPARGTRGPEAGAPGGDATC
ncbi:hypothetical protein [Actinomycetospora lemnae]|uniref:Uncharacterized protein n=1 Tax=Actinomycetospora lemnae TaxID=3019891 RepID=A0ABT5SZ61_9PSEU|nr:hypothetical protein [Actinomycetospora sp. DW7H6]MDD7968158.1 hypothetical protein [Actinomycetospora sp. DW7H6]